MDIKDKIFNFLSIHESIVSNNMKNRGDNINVKFTTFGNRAGCKALTEVIEMLDEDTKIKVIEMMENKRIN